MKITLNNQQHEFRFRFKALKQLSEQTGLALDNLEAFVQDIKNVPTILSIGCGITIEEAEDLLDLGTFDEVREVVAAFSSEVIAFTIPNSQSQAN